MPRENEREPGQQGRPVVFDPPHGDAALHAFARASRQGLGVEAGLVYPLFRGEPPVLSSGEIRDRVRFQLRELARLAGSGGVRILRASLEGPLAEIAGRDRRVARAAVHGVQASFTGIPLAAAPGSLPAREARRLALRVVLP